MLTRHGESTLNFENRINGDPAVPVALTAKGREEALLLGQQIAHIRLDVCICTRFSRTRETAEIALAGRDVPIEVEPLLDDIDVGESRGSRARGLPRLEARAHAQGSVSRRRVARRRGPTLRAGLPQATRTIPRHRCSWSRTRFPLRYAINAADGSDDLDGPAHQLPNATPYVFDEEALTRAIEGIERVA